MTFEDETRYLLLTEKRLMEEYMDPCFSVKTSHQLCTNTRRPSRRTAGVFVYGCLRGSRWGSPKGDGLATIKDGAKPHTERLIYQSKRSGLRMTRRVMRHLDLARGGRGKVSSISLS